MTSETKEPNSPWDGHCPRCGEPVHPAPTSEALLWRCQSCFAAFRTEEIYPNGLAEDYLGSLGGGCGD